MSTPSYNLKLRLVNRDGMGCHWCGKATSLAVSINCPDHCTLEHILPLSLGGPTDAENCVIACRWCNNARKDSLGPPPPRPKHFTPSVKHSSPLSRSAETDLGRHFVSRYAERKTYAEALLDLTWPPRR